MKLLSLKPFLGGDFVKKCLITASEDLCPQNVKYLQIYTSQEILAERCDESLVNIHGQLKDEYNSFTAFSIATDERTDISDAAQLAVFIHGVDKTIQLTEEFVKLMLMKETTTADDILQSLMGTLDKLCVDWVKTVFGYR